MAPQPVISLASLSRLCTLCIQKAQPDRQNAGNIRNDVGNLMVVLRNTMKLNILGSPCDLKGRQWTRCDY